LPWEIGGWLSENKEVNKDNLIYNMLKYLHIPLDDDLIAKLSLYVALLEEGLKKQRLTGEKAVNDIINKQVLDSIYPVKLLELFAGSNVLDLGSGGGLPGIPIKLCKPEVSMHLLEANKNKASFLNHAIDQLKLKNTQVLCGRAERIGQDEKYRNKFDLILCKAVAETAVLAELALPMTRINGRVILYKGPKGEDELIKARRAIEICGGVHEQTYDYKLPTGEERKLYLIKKIKETPGRYPRREGKPEKKPLK